jgi:hypothetical protein
MTILWEFDENILNKLALLSVGPLGFNSEGQVSVSPLRLHNKA